MFWRSCLTQGRRSTRRAGVRVLIAIPSKGRPTGVATQRLLRGSTVFVPAVEVAAYQRAGVLNVVGVPGSVRGITATRNWILDHAGDPWVVFVDDDLARQGWQELRDENGTSHRLTEAEWTEAFVRAFELTEQMGFRIWGVSTDGARRSVYPYRPFIFQTYVTASCMGILNDGRTRFDESFKVKEDYELCLRCIKEDGGVLGIRYVYLYCEHWTTPGGCRDYRTQEMEREATERLMRMYPGLIRRVTRGGSEYSIELDF